MSFIKKNWFLIIPIIIGFILISLFNVQLLNVLIIVVASFTSYAIFKVQLLKKYLKKNWYLVLGLIFAIGWGMSNKDGSYWKDFEMASIMMTVIYSIALYIKMFYYSDVDKDALKSALPSLLIAIISISISCFASVEGNFQVGSTNNYISIPGSRDVTLGLLCLGTLFFCVVNYTLYKSNTEHKDTFLKSLQYSDFPVFVTFLILWSTVIPFHSSLHDPILEAFYGGTIAFQMIYSNIVWSFIDDPLIASHITQATN